MFVVILSLIVSGVLISGVFFTGRSPGRSKDPQHTSTPVKVRLAIILIEEILC